MVYKKGVGLFKNGCDSNFKYLGVKKFGGEVVKVGNILVCQCGIKFKVGQGVGMGCDYILFVFFDGKVVFINKGKGVCFISIEVVQIEVVVD